MPEYEFFVSGEAPRPANRAMRSHAMRTALASRSRRLTEPAGQTEEEAGSSASRQTEELKSALKGRFRLTASTALDTRKRAVNSSPSREPSPVDSAESPADPPSPSSLMARRKSSPVLRFSSLGMRALDPFGVLPVENNWRVDRLIQYCKDMYMCYTTGPYFLLAMSEPLVMRGTLALSCAIWAMNVPSLDRSLVYEGLYQKTQAIKEVNREINRFPREVSDAMILAVANLANVAALEGSFHEADMHARGLKRLVDARGGAMVFKDTYHLAQAICWVDLKTATGVGRTPLFPLTHGYLDVHLPQYILDHGDVPDLSHILDPGIDTEDNEDVMSVFRCLRQSVAAKKHKVGGQVPTRRLHNIADVYILRRLDSQPLTPDEYRLRTLCLAAHIFMYHGLRLIQRDSPLVGKMVRRLWEALANREAIAVAAWPRTRLRELLWMLFVGKVVADGHGLGPWFDVRLRTVIGMAECRTRTEVEDVLRRYVWNEMYGRQVLDGIWESGVEIGGGEGNARALEGEARREGDVEDA